MTIAQALKKYSAIEADLLLGHVLKQSKEFLYLHDDKKLTSVQQNKFLGMTKKRQTGLPVAYLIGYKYFYGLKFKVNKDVLIPRPETEWIVDKTLQIIGKKPLSIIDVGTGSGCIAISLAKNSKAKIFATDISNRALKVAKENAKINKVKIDFSKHNLLEGVKGKFDVIIANLPYVPVSEYKKFKKNLKFEPKLALTDGTNDFILIEKLLTQASGRLNSNGKILLEIDPLFAMPLKRIVKNLMPNKKCEVFKDLNKLDRYIFIH